MMTTGQEAQVVSHDDDGDGGASRVEMSNRMIIVVNIRNKISLQFFYNISLIYLIVGL